jgi:hypothetical protein
MNCKLIDLTALTLTLSRGEREYCDDGFMSEDSIGISFFIFV